MTRKVLPFFLIFSLLLLVACIFIPNKDLRLGMTALISFLTIATTAIMFLPWSNHDDLKEE